MVFLKKAWSPIIMFFGITVKPLCKCDLTGLILVIYKNRWKSEKKNINEIQEPRISLFYWIILQRPLKKIQN